MSEFGDLADLDIDKLIRMSKEMADRSAELQERILAVKGQAESADKRVKVTCTASEGVSDLHLDPRALRMQANTLAETIKTVIREANQDLQSKVNSVIVDIHGEDASPVKLREQQEALQQRVTEAAAVHERVVNDALGELERMRKQLGI